MKSDKMDIDGFLSDESFINYCKGTSMEDVVFWENYRAENPDHKLMVDYAKEKFLQIFNALAESDLEEQVARLTQRLNQTEPAPIVQFEKFEKKKSNFISSTVFKFSIAAAVLLPAFFFIIKYYNSDKHANIKIFDAAYGERKNIQLPDGSNVTLNGGSSIQINESFGLFSRDVFLVGEAFFDVKHNATHPFIVHTSTMDIKALGTSFDVKAYGDEKITETSLIKGIVEVTLKESNNRTVLLYPNQKISWEHSLAEGGSGKLPIAAKENVLQVTDSLMKKLTVTSAGDIKEIAWKENKLIFEDELFSNIAILLERWYGLKVEFKDDAIRNYRFTGIFEKEDLTTVLGFLKESRNFNYSIEAGEPLKVKLSR